MTTNGPALRIGLMWRGDPSAPPPSPAETRFERIFDAFAARGAVAEPVIYAEEVAEAVRERLMQMDGVLVWVDPIVRCRARGALDEMLRELARQGVFVSAHPDVIEKMGAKDVLYRTREMRWGTDTRLYRDSDDLRSQLPPLLRAGSARVLKQNRGSGGNGVWKVELIHDEAPFDQAIVRVQHAQRGATIEDVRFADLVARCQEYFEAFGGTGCIIDQPYAERLDEGMIRCYLVHDRVAGFGQHFVTALLPPAPGEQAPPGPPPRVYYGSEKPEFQPIKGLMEGGWVAQMQRLVGVDTESLPVVWDADFLLGPRDSAGNDTYILCEVNVSGVFPIPEEAAAPLAAAAVEKTEAARRRRNSPPPA